MGRCVESSESSPRGEPACGSSFGTSAGSQSWAPTMDAGGGCKGPARRATGLRPRGTPARIPQTSSRMGTETFGLRPGGRGPFVKGLILAQNERWRRGLGMQVERVQQCTSGGRVSKATATNPEDGYSRGKLRVIPSDARASASTLRQMDPSASGRAVVVLGRWRGSGPPSL